MSVEVEYTQLSDVPRFDELASSSRKIRRVSQSSFAAETPEACASADHAFAVRKIYEEMVGTRMLCFRGTDSLNLRNHNRCVPNNTAEKRLPVDLHGLKQYFLEDGLSGLLWIDGAENIADSLTKNTPILLRILNAGRLDLASLV